jgi:hypothetical protein
MDGVLYVRMTAPGVPCATWTPEYGNQRKGRVVASRNDWIRAVIHAVDQDRVSETFEPSPVVVPSN